MPNVLKQVFSKVFGGLWTHYGGQGFTRFRFLMPGSRFDYEREAGDLWSNPVVGLCLDWLGNRFPRPLLHVSRIDARSGEYTPLGRHLLTDLWDRPNPYYSRRTMEKAIGLSLKTDGNAYIYKVRDNGGRPVELWWIPHYRIMPTWPSDGSAYVDGYKVKLDSVVYQLPPEDVIHIRDGIDPRNERLGLCALRSCYREVCTINEESGYRASILRNSGVPGLVVIPDTDTLRVKQDDADAIRERFHELAGGDNRGNTVVMAGKYRVEILGFSPEQLNLVDLPVIPTARITSALGVAPMSVGLPDPGKTYANLGEANRSSWGTIVATQEIVAEALRWDLLPEFGGDPYSMTVEYDYTHIQELQESLDAVHARARDDWTVDLITKNEAREQIGMEPDPDGDQYHSQATQVDVPSIGEDGEPMGKGKAKATGDVQRTALNGAQITGLVAIGQAVADGTLPPETARAMIEASFPSLDEAIIGRIVDPTIDFEPATPELDAMAARLQLGNDKPGENGNGNGKPAAIEDGKRWRY